MATNHRTIRCKPKSLFSRDFHLEGLGHHASLEFNWTSEQGTLDADGACFEIDKHGVFSGHWTLLEQGQVVASAQKTSALMRTFEIESPMGDLLLRAESIFTRSFRLERSGLQVASFKADHPFTRNTQLQISDPEFHFPTLAFTFWLIVITRRRAQRNNS